MREWAARKHVLLLLAAAAALALPLPVQPQVVNYLGVPYAAAPTGALRWRAPLPPGERRSLDRLPPRCPQSAAGLASGAESEDCLYVNVYAPAAHGPQAHSPQSNSAAPKTGARPVLVYLHGGGAVAGSANDHDGSALAAAGKLIVVSVNYRLGALGFMDSALLAAGAPHGRSGNYALLDVIAALEWVQARIAGFGGDPRRVTLAGESAGATVLCPLLAMPELHGLFRAAIISSDDCLHDIATQAVARSRADALQRSLGCLDAPCLRQRSPAELVRAGGQAGPSVAGGTLVPRSAFDAVARKEWRRIPLMIGANRDEGRIAGADFIAYGEADYRAWVERIVPAAAPAVLAAYRNEGAGERFPLAEKIAAIITDSGMRGFGGCTSLALARNAAGAAPVFYYQFEDDAAPASQRSLFRLGAAHGAELPYLWPRGPFAGQAAAMTPRQRTLSGAMMAHWAAFIHHASPNAAGLPYWPALEAGTGDAHTRQRRRQRQAGAGDGGGQASGQHASEEYYMAFAAPAGRLRKVEAFAREHRCRLWNALPAVMDRGEP